MNGLKGSKIKFSQPKPMRPGNHIHRGHVPFVRFLLALLAGIGMGYALPAHAVWNDVLWAFLYISSLAFVAVCLLTGLNQYRYYGLLGFLFFCILCCVGWISTWRPHPEIDKAHFSHYETTALIGYIADEPVLRGEHMRMPFAVWKGHGGDTVRSMSGTILLTIKLSDSTAAYPYRYGDMLVIPAAYTEVAPPYNPGELDYKRFLANKSIWHQAYLHLPEIRKLDGGKGNPLIAFALEIRQKMVAKFARYIHHKDAYSVASTLILGYRADLSRELLNAFSATGTIHVLSVSGMHVVIVFWLLSLLLGWMNRSKGLRLAKWAVMLACIWAYALVTGFSPSVLRAAIMISFVITATHFGQKARIYNSIAASAFFLLLYDPKFIADVGFQLSYLAVLSIVFLVPKLQSIFTVRNRFAKPVWDYTLMSVSAQAGAFPLAMYYFHHFPLYFLPANLLIVLPATGIMYLGFALLLLPESMLSVWIAKGLEQLILMTNSALSHIEHMPMASLRGIWLEWWEYMLIYALMLSLVLAFTFHHKRSAYAAMACLLLLSFSSFMTTLGKITGRQLVVYHVRANLAIGIMYRGEVLLYSSLPSLEDRVIQYSVLPHLESYTSVGNIRFVAQDSSYQGRAVFIRQNVLQLGDKRLFVYEGNPVYTDHLSVDVLLLRNNPAKPLAEILEMVSCKRLVIDGSNYSRTIGRMEKEAAELGIPVYVLKDNFAYVWDIDKQGK